VTVTSTDCTDRAERSQEPTFDGERTRRILEDRNLVLERIATGAPLEEVLTLLCSACEAAEPAVLCSVLLHDPARGTLMHAAGPSLPAEYIRGVDGLRVGPEVGSCGSAAYTNTRVIVADVMDDARWSAFRELAQSADLRACWSEPIRSSKGALLGTFAMYFRKPRSPSMAQLEFIATSAHIAGLAIERHQAELELEHYRTDLEGLVQARTAELEQANSELRRVLSEVKVLSGMLPICSACKRVRDDRGYWAQIESYVAEHSQAEFTHGICPECVGELYPGHRRIHL
jgi:GAF domain-containing protein